MPTFSPNDVIPVSFLNSIPRENLETEEVVLNIPLSWFRYYDGTVPTTTASTGKPAIVMGNWDAPQGYFEGQDAQGSTKTEYLLCGWLIPAEWKEQVTFGVRVRANDSGSNTLNTASVAVRAWKRDASGTIGSNIVTTAAQTFTKTWATYEFVGTDTTLSPGDVLRFMIKTELLGSSGGTLKMQINAASLTIQLRG